MNPVRLHPQSRLSQQGAATLVVVMVLFFVMAMMAAFANRNLLFEQRIASNYYRSTVAQEVADAGSEWALSMLNGAHIDAACKADATGGNSFRERYLDLSQTSTTRDIKPLVTTSSGYIAGCARSATNPDDWVCKCPNANSWTNSTALPESSFLQPSFRVSLAAVVNGAPKVKPGMVRIVSRSCSSSDMAACAQNASAVQTALSQVSLTFDAALVSALKMPPATPLTVRGVVSGGNALGLHNADARGGGLLMLSGGDATGLVDARLDSLPGTPVQQALLKQDNRLAGSSVADMFKMFFGMAWADYRDQPAMRRIVCTTTDCGPTLAAAYAAGLRMVWVDGPVTIGSNVTLGSATSPMLIIANGEVSISGPMQVNGLIYARGNVVWTNGSGTPSLIAGALLAEGDLTVTGTADIWYRASIMDELSNRTGSFVRVPGSWWDS